MRLARELKSGAKAYAAAVANLLDELGATNSPLLVPAGFGIVYADERTIADIREDQSLQQVANVAHLPGIVSASLATKLQGHGSRLVPDKVKAEMHRRMAEPGSAED